MVEVLPRDGEAEKFELAAGPMCMSMAGDMLVGAVARRFATPEAAGTHEELGEDLLMLSVTGGSCFGALTSKSCFSKDLLPLRHLGHGMFEGHRLGMKPFVPTSEEIPFDISGSLHRRLEPAIGSRGDK